MPTITLPALAFSIIAIIIILSIIYDFIKSDGRESKIRFILVFISIAFSILFLIFIVGFGDT